MLLHSMFSYLLCSTATISGVIDVNQKATVSVKAVFYFEMNNLRVKSISRCMLDMPIIASLHMSFSMRISLIPQS